MAGTVDPQIYPARPKFFVDGEEKADLGEALLSLQVEETSAGLYRCEVVFANWGPKDGAAGFLYFDRRVLDFGKKLRIEAGGGVGAGQVFEGRITAIEGRFLRERPVPYVRVGKKPHHRRPPRKDRLRWKKWNTRAGRTIFG